MILVNPFWHTEHILSDVALAFADIKVDGVQISLCGLHKYLFFWSLKVLAGHGRHVLSCVLFPSNLMYVPASQSDQSWQTLWPNFPFGQDSHWVSETIPPSFLTYSPFWHDDFDKQDVWPFLSWYWPVEQLVQDKLKIVVLNVPTSQSWHMVFCFLDDISACWPSKQFFFFSQNVFPSKSWKYPFWHGVHDGDDVWLEKDPEGHIEHTSFCVLLPTLITLDPGWQGVLGLHNW